jgi:hypothetical protein
MYYAFLDVDVGFVLVMVGFRFVLEFCCYGLPARQTKNAMRRQKEERE